MEVETRSHPLVVCFIALLPFPDGTRSALPVLLLLLRSGVSERSCGAGALKTVTRNNRIALKHVSCDMVDENGNMSEAFTKTRRKHLNSMQEGFQGFMTAAMVHRKELLDSAEYLSQVLPSCLDKYYFLGP